MESALYPAAATVTAAFIAGGIAYLSSVLGKEQKTSEFRYSWLNAVLDDIATFAGAAESISSTARALLKTHGNDRALSFLASSEPQIREALAAYYRARIRLYPREHREVISKLDHLQALLLTTDLPDHSQIELLKREVVVSSHAALRTEWGRVKRGEITFVVTKYVSLALFVAALLAAIAFARYGHY